jgi:CHAT domain-containing protein
MGKGKRNRDQRKRFVDPDQVIGLLLEVETQEQFLALVDDYPALLKDAVRRQLSEMVAAPPGLVFKRWERLVADARRDPVAAWETHALTLAHDEEIGREIEREVEKIQEAERRREPARIVELAEPAVAMALEAELAPAVAILEAMRAHAFLNRPDGNRQDNIDQAIAGFGRALTMTIVAEEAARLHMYMGIAMAERGREDPSDNLEAALNALRQGLEILPPEGSPDLRSTIQTNLATTLLRRQRGEKIENLTEALGLCREVLKYRSIDRDPNEWAVVQLNYAPTLQQLATLGEVDRAEAEAAFLEVIDAASLIDDDKVANAQYQLGRMLRISAEFNPEQFVEDWDPDARDNATQEAEEAETERLLSEAREYLEAAIELYQPEHEPAATGRAFTELATVLDRLECMEEATGSAEEGLRLLPLTTDPRESARVAGTLGNLHARQGNWDRSAAAFRAAVEAAEFAFYSRLDSSFREQEAKSTLNLSRWAAFAVAAAGDAPEALMILESGRSRDLRHRLGLGEAASRDLDELPDELRLRYINTTKDLACSPLGEEGAAAGRALQEVLRDIRRIEGFEAFATRPNQSDLLGALEADWPIMYVNPTPYGTLLLLLEQSGEEATADALFLDQPTSLEVLMRLLAGDGAESPDLIETAEYGSFLSGASGFGGAPRDVQKDVEHVLPWLGESLAAPIHDALTSAAARGVTLVPCGPIALAPLHAAPWGEGDATRYLVDDFEIRYAPSATFAAAGLSRANQRAQLEASLVALVDPENNLSAARAEFEELSGRFGDRILHAEGADADWSYLKAHAADGTHLHLACHARSGVWGESLPAVNLADGPVDVTRLTELAELPSRLVTVSACQSAVIDISHMPEEGISVGTVLVAAGAACVIASLWPVRSDTTALLMTRLYDEMLQAGLRPPEALRRAQLWLRDLTDDGLDSFLARHPSLEGEFRRRAALGDRPGVRSTAVRRRSSAHIERPFSGPDYWAPFVAIGA